jgi:hypothetical protein
VAALRVAAERDRGGDACFAAWDALHLERATVGLDPVDETPQARSAGGVGPADAVVRDLNPDVAVVGRGGDGHGDLGCVGVLGDVGKGLGADEVDGRRDRLGELGGGDPDIDRNGEIVRHGCQRALQPTLG